MRPNKRPLIYLLLVALLLLVGLLAACSNQGGQTSGGSQETGTSQPTESAVAEATSAVSEETGGEVAEVEVTRIVEVPVESAPSVAIPFYDEWANSPHNDTEGEPFNHWNEDDPPEVPTDCAKCHSTPGYIDHLGADGSTPGVVDVAAPIGTTVQCTACHNEVTLDKTSVMFPSGIEITNLGDEARCM
ncbi:MAG TPA: hypothetical protein PKZ19_18200, partial [Zoogloea sp.]|nr:hypothetical protein [Zoogloea sp.]